MQPPWPHPSNPADPSAAAEQAARLRRALPPQGLLQGLEWRFALEPFPLEPALARDLATLGRVLHQFYRAAHRLYRLSLEGRQPPWIAHWLDLGKPADLLARQRDPAFRQDIPRVIRPDLLLTDEGYAITELDSVPGGIGLTAWLNQTYAAEPAPWAGDLLGGARGMHEGFAAIFGDAPQVHIVVSTEAATYRPEMLWLAETLNADARFTVHDETFTGFRPGSAVYRFFELFDLPNIPAANALFDAAAAGHLRLTPPPKPLFEEKLLLALLWNRNLRTFWRQELGEGFLNRLLRHVPYTWVVDPTPLPPHGAIPELNLTDWHQLKGLSQRERDLILKVSGFHETAWGARSVFLGSDLSAADWAAAVDQALQRFAQSPFVLQRYHKPRRVEVDYYDPAGDRVVRMPGRVRLCPYYFVVGDGDQARTRLGGVLATICPADKKIIHGMQDAVLAPCRARP